MRFPGRRKHKHYFPVNARDPLFQHAGLSLPKAKTHVVGIDQTLVDIDARIPEELGGWWLLVRASKDKAGDGAAVIVRDRAQMVRDVLRSLGQPLATTDVVAA